MVGCTTGLTHGRKTLYYSPGDSKLSGRIATARPGIHFPLLGRKMHYMRFEKDLDVDNQDCGARFEASWDTNMSIC